MLQQLRLRRRSRASTVLSYVGIVSTTWKIDVMGSLHGSQGLMISPMTMTLDFFRYRYYTESVLEVYLSILLSLGLVSTSVISIH